MSEEPFTNRELQEMFKAADDRADAFHDKLMERMSTFEQKTCETLDRIEEQTKKTNGSIAAINKWRERVNGGAWVAGMGFIFVIVPILGWGLYMLANIKDTVKNDVKDTISEYNLPIKPNQISLP